MIESCLSAVLSRLTHNSRTGAEARTESREDKHPHPTHSAAVLRCLDVSQWNLTAAGAMKVMNRAMHLRHLEQAERHVAEGERHLTKQEERVSKMTGGWDMVLARKLLETFRVSQQQHIAHRDMILRELEVSPQ
jgi:hypothetical protein